MKFRRDKKMLFLLLMLLALLIWLAMNGMTMLVQRRMESFLIQHGVGQAMITGFSRNRGSEVMFTDVKLDPDGFSTIGAIRAQVRWPFLISAEPFSEIIIDHLALTGELDENGTLTIAGLKAGALSPLIKTNSFILDGGQLDLTTPSGALRLQARGRMTKQDDGSQKFDGALWGQQYQLVLDTRWSGLIAPDGNWNTATDVQEARINMQHLSASRVTGWFTAKGIIGKTPKIAGQLDAGQIKIGQKTILGGINITFDGLLDQYHVILHAAANDYKDTVITADLTRTLKDLTIHASVETKTIGDLLSFMSNLNGDLQLALPHVPILTTLLLTPGNMTRINAEAQALKYDHLQLDVNGLPGVLDGKIIAYEGNKIVGTINMNPGNIPSEAP